MTTFTRQEYQTLALGLDALVRNEGGAINNAGVDGLSKSLGQVNLRFACAVSAYEKIGMEMQAMAEAAAAQAEAAAAEQPDSEPQEPTTKTKPKATSAKA